MCQKQDNLVQEPQNAGIRCKCGGKLYVERTVRGNKQVVRVHRCENCDEVYSSVQYFG